MTHGNHQGGGGKGGESEAGNEGGKEEQFSGLSETYGPLEDTDLDLVFLCKLTYEV